MQYHHSILTRSFLNAFAITMLGLFIYNSLLGQVSLAIPIAAETADETRLNHKNYYINEDVLQKALLLNEIDQSDPTVFHLFSHGTEGKLFIDERWMTAQDIAAWLPENFRLQGKSHLNIYGCNFAKGEYGLSAVKFLEEALGISVAASDDITGVEGDWDLEVGTPSNSVCLKDYKFNLQNYVMGTSPATNGATITTCTGTFYDSGGSSGNYATGTWEEYLALDPSGATGKNIEFVCANVICENPWDLTITNTYYNNCSGSGSTYTADWKIAINTGNAPDNAISFQRNSEAVQTHTLTGNTDTLTITGIPADGGAYDTLKVWFTNDMTCGDTIILKRPVPCPTTIPGVKAGEICASVANTEIKGTVFEDWNHGGIMNQSDTVGVAGVQVLAYNCNNNLVGTTYSDANGNYQFTGLTTSETYRIEFVLPEAVACFYCPTNAGANNGTTVQFVHSGECASLGLGEIFVCPAGTIVSTFNMLMSCGTRTSFPDSDEYTIGAANLKPFTYSPTLVTPTEFHHPDWILNQIGNIGHLAFDQSGNGYAAATSFMGAPFGNWVDVGWRFGNIGGGANAPAAGGTIYKLDAATGQPTVFAQLPQQSVAIRIESEDFGNFPRNRTASPGLFGMSFDQDHQQLLVANVEDGKIYRIDLSGNWSATDAFDPLVADDGSVGWASRNGEMVTAVEYHKGRVYYGIRDDSSPNNLQVRSVAILSDGSFDPTTDRVEILTTQYNSQISYVRDIEFSQSGWMAIGCMGRVTSGSNEAAATFTIYNHVASNSIWVYNEGGNQWERTANYDPSFANSVSQVESYGGIDWGTYESHKSELLWSSSADITPVTNALDDIHGVIAYPVAGLPNAPQQSGGPDFIYIQYPASVGGSVDPKGVGGDVELFNSCDCILSIEIGNYVWNDLDQDGIQDACETGISGVVVELVKAGNVIATYTTGTNGEYYFSNKNAAGVTWTGTGVDTTLLPNTTYVLRISNAEGGSQLPTLDGLLLTLSNVNSNNSNNVDNDASLNGNHAEITAITGDLGCADHNFDFGFAPNCTQPLAINLSLTAPTCSGATAQNNGKITLTAITNADKFGVSSGATYSGTPDYSAATVIGSLPQDLQTAIPNTGGTYTIRFFNGTDDCYKDTTVTTATVMCCPTITNPSATQSLCVGSSGTNITVQTDQNAASSIKFVQFTSAQTDAATIYSGTQIGATVTPIGGSSPYTATYTWNSADFPNATASPITYYMYAILNPDAGTSCRPYQEIQVTVNPLPSIANATLSCPSGGGGAASSYDFNTTGTWTVLSQPASGAALVTGTGAVTGMTLPGDYTFRITVNGCSDDATITVPVCCPVKTCVPIIITKL